MKILAGLLCFTFSFSNSFALTFETLENIDNQELHFSFPTDITADGTRVAGIGFNFENADSVMKIWDSVNPLPDYESLCKHLKSFEYTSPTAISPNGRFLTGKTCGTNPNLPPGLVPSQAFIAYDDGKVLGLGDLGGGGEYEFSTATDLSNDGKIVVGQGLGSLGWSPFIWTKREGMKELPSPSDEIIPYRAGSIDGAGKIILGYAKRNLDQQVVNVIWDEKRKAHSLKGYFGLSDLYIFYTISNDGRFLLGQKGNENGAEAVIFDIKTKKTISYGHLPNKFILQYFYAASQNADVLVGTMRVKSSKKKSISGDYYTEGLIYTKKTGLLSANKFLNEHDPQNAKAWYIKALRGVSSNGKVLVGTCTKRDNSSVSVACKITL
jgi:uncharacterized membrane protein